MEIGQTLFDAAGCGKKYTLGADCFVGSPTDASSGSPTKHPALTAQEAYLQVKASLSFDAASPGVGPDHSVNHLRSEVTGKPLDSVVGYPLWFWAVGGDQQPKQVTRSVGGMKVALSLRPTGLTVDPGDGASFSCPSMGTPWRRGTEVGAKSPTCGHVYQKVGTYRVSMTTHWSVHYEVDDGSGPVLSGDETVSGVRSRLLRIGELQVVVDR